MLGHMRARGFTVVELIITIAIMGILLILTVVSVTETQKDARDNERKADVEAISLNFENFYTNRKSDIAMSGSSYVGMNHLGETELLATVIPEVDPKSLRAPGVDSSSPISLIPATNTNQTVTGVLPQPTLTTYVYQAFTSAGALCYDPTTNAECRKFNIFYLLEKTNTVQKVESKNR
jgi:prepilin-type N-terminal cleavage/methylation domain-containing protein